MKKLLSLLLALVMIFSLCACSDSGDSGKDSDKDKEETEYPIVCEFRMDGMEYTLEIQEKTARVSFIRTLTAEDLEWMDIYVDDVTVEYHFHTVGSYKLRKGVYTVTLDTLLGSMTIRGDDADEAKEGLIAYFKDTEEDSRKYENMVNGKEEDITAEEYYTGGIMKVELDDGELKSMITYMDDDDSNYVEYIFHSNGQVKTETHYEGGEIYAKFTYDKKGNQTDEWYPGSDATGRPNETVTPMPPETYPTAPETYPTEPETEYWDYAYYANGNLKSETYYENGIATVQWEYYQNGSTESYRTWYDNGQPCHLETYDENGYMTQRSSYYYNGNPEVTERFNNKGQIISVKNFTEEGCVLSDALFYSNGNTQQELFYYYNGGCESAYYYDEDGDLDEYYRFYENGQVHCYEDHSDGVLLEGYLYDEFGNLTDYYGESAIATRSMIHNEEETVVWSQWDMIEYGDSYFTLDGVPLYICWNAPLENWLGGNALKAYVDAYGTTYFDTTYVNSLNAHMDTNGYVLLTIESYQWLVTTISGNSNWGEDESHFYLYLAYPAD